MATKLPDDESNFATNLRRLLLFEHRSGKEAAVALGVTEASVSRWLTGKRYPSAEALIAMDRLYGVSPRQLDDDPVEFAQALADPVRMQYAEAMRKQAAKKGEITAADAARESRKAQAKQQEIRDALSRKVVPLRRGTKK
jgi:transcriptional regulator with XRE-family HTH domain